MFFQGVFSRVLGSTSGLWTFLEGHSQQGPEASRPWGWGLTSAARGTGSREDQCLAMPGGGLALGPVMDLGVESAFGSLSS